MDTTHDAAEATARLENGLRRASDSVHDLDAAIRSALRVLDDAELDGAKARLSDRGERYLELAAEHLGRLNSRCRDVREINEEMTAHLTAAADSVQRLEDLSARLDPADPHTVPGSAALSPRTAVLREMVDLARPVAEDLRAHVDSAEHASRSVTAEGMLSLSRLERGVQVTGVELGRANEDARFLDRVVERASSASREARDVAEEMYDAAAQRMTHHETRGPTGAQVPSPRSGAVSR